VIGTHEGLPLLRAYCAAYCGFSSHHGRIHPAYDFDLADSITRRPFRQVNQRGERRAKRWRGQDVQPHQVQPFAGQSDGLAEKTFNGRPPGVDLLVAVSFTAELVSNARNGGPGQWSRQLIANP
jgi:hypothetical protein